MFGVGFLHLHLLLSAVEGSLPGEGRAKHWIMNIVELQRTWSILLQDLLTFQFLLRNWLIFHCFFLFHVLFGFLLLLLMPSVLSLCSIYLMFRCNSLYGPVHSVTFLDLQLFLKVGKLTSITLLRIWSMLLKWDSSPSSLPIFKD